MERVLRGWNFMRWLRLGIGVYALVAAVQQQELILGIAGVFQTAMAVFGFGCCAGGYCAPMPGKNSRTTTTGTSIQFEEIKSDK